VARGAVIGSRGSTAKRSGWVTRAIGAQQPQGGQAIELETDMGKLSTELAQGAADSVVGAFETRIPKYMKTVRSYWPYKTGYSQGRFRLAVRQVDAFFQLSIVNDADYSGWIRHKDERPVLVAVRLLFNPFSPVAAEIARDIADFLGD
jgi:hypothetical protein